MGHKSVWLDHSIRSAKKTFFSEKFKRCTGDVKTTWKVLNELLQREKATSELPSVFLDGENSFNNPSHIAEKCNDFFVNIDYELANKVSSCHGNPLDFIPRTFLIISSFKPPDIQEISNIIDELKASSAGHDNIPAFVVKQVKLTILQPLVHIYSLCLKTGDVSEDLIVARVIPLFKADDPCVLW